MLPVSRVNPSISARLRMLSVPRTRAAKLHFQLRGPPRLLTEHRTTYHDVQEQGLISIHREVTAWCFFRGGCQGFSGKTLESPIRRPRPVALCVRLLCRSSHMSAAVGEGGRSSLVGQLRVSFLESRNSVLLLSFAPSVSPATSVVCKPFFVPAFVCFRCFGLGCGSAQLARRLLHETSASEDLEKSVIGKLKLKCGSHFTSKLEGMLHDLNGASDTYRKFVQWILEKKKLDHASSGRREVASAPTTTSDSKEGRERGDVRDRGMESPVSGESEQKKDLFEAVSVIATGQHHHHQRGGGVGSGVAVVEGIEFSVQILTTGHWPTYPSEC